MMLKVTIDGQSLEVPEGTSILQAAAILGIDIPIFCSHDALSVAANCRMCLVEVADAPKLLPACEVPVRDNMVVTTNSPLVKEARQSTLEFLLVNHPVDCPICDCAGECLLQEHYMAHSGQPSRINVKKVRKGKRLPIGPHVMLDQERCINCTRCVRFTREITGSEQLVQLERGAATQIGPFPGTEFTDAYSLCTVDLCPVGALTSRDFRFRQRVWWLEQTPSICPECARGCALTVDHHQGSIYRLRPRHNAAVNGHWACDYGRLAYHRYAAQRITGGFTGVRIDTEAEVSQLVAAQRVLDELVQARRSGLPVAVVLNASSSLEDGYALLRVVQGPLSGATVFLGSRAPGAPDHLLRMADSHANTTGLTRLAGRMGVPLHPAAALFSGGEDWAAVAVVGAELELPPPSRPERVGPVAVFAWRHNEITRLGRALVPLPAHFEQHGHYVNGLGVVQEARAAIPPPAGLLGLGLLLQRVIQDRGGDLGYRNGPGLTRLALAAYTDEVRDG
jgi:NADH-quinone oxidoreductase subunit G